MKDSLMKGEMPMLFWQKNNWCRIVYKVTYDVYLTKKYFNIEDIIFSLLGIDFIEVVVISTRIFVVFVSLDRKPT